ncbi:MAG TPA: hypothetical protein VLE47_00065 [Candidatus Saccharimonadales bacterium]|nr:hypothetical protein [Candidatus Saccharimonadales bacterium]
MDFKSSPAPVFSVNKKHAWRDTASKIVGLILIALVILGTLFWLLFSTHFSFSNSFKGVLANLSPKIATTETKKKVESEQDKLRVLLQKAKLFEIESITKTDEGDFLVKGKDNLVVYFSSDKDLASQVTTLQSLLTKARIENKAFKKVDFRFEKTVVQY